MRDAQVLWDLPDDPDGNVQHIAEHGVTMDEVEEVLADPESVTKTGKTSGRPITFGETVEGRCLAVVWETALEDPLTIYPITAYDVPRRRLRRK